MNGKLEIIGISIASVRVQVPALHSSIIFEPIPILVRVYCRWWFYLVAVTNCHVLIESIKLLFNDFIVRESIRLSLMPHHNIPPEVCC